MALRKCGLCDKLSEEEIKKENIMHNTIDYPITEKDSYRVPFVYGCSRKGLVFPGAHKNEIVSMRNLVEACMDLHFAEEKTYQKVFFKGADALLRSEEDLEDLLGAAKKAFPALKAASLYAMPTSVLVRDMARLKEAGLTGVYLGVAPREGVNILNAFSFDSREEEKAAAEKLHKAGLKVYGVVVAGYAKNVLALSTHLKALKLEGVEVRRPRTANVVPLPPGKDDKSAVLPEETEIEQEIRTLKEEMEGNIWIENL